jgi:hypothetical protein
MLLPITRLKLALCWWAAPSICPANHHTLPSIFAITIKEAKSMEASTIGSVPPFQKPVRVKAPGATVLALSLLAAGLYSSCGFAQVSTQYPFCLQGDDNPGWSNCSFTSFQQCQATASGTLDECMANPWYKPSRQDQIRK